MRISMKQAGHGYPSRTCRLFQLRSCTPACVFSRDESFRGRGTTMPFKFAGAPFIDGFAWKDQTLKEGLKLEGAVLRPVSFIPKFKNGPVRIVTVCRSMSLIAVRSSRFAGRWRLSPLLRNSIRMSSNDCRRMIDKFVGIRPPFELIRIEFLSSGDKRHRQRSGSNALRSVTWTCRPLQSLPAHFWNLE